MSESQQPPNSNLTSAVTSTTPAGGHGPAAAPGDSSRAADEFARQAEQAPPGLLAEFWDFLIHNKKWWLTPIILVLLLATALILLSGTAVGPFIYPGL
jgi:hypothetical protein